MSSGISLKHKVYSGGEESGVARRLQVVVNAFLTLPLQRLRAVLLNVFLMLNEPGVSAPLE